MFQKHTTVRVSKKSPQYILETLIHREIAKKLEDIKKATLHVM
jgi:hypothetical protein